MLDFTSALYLGLHHSSRSLGGWEALTLGRPAALQEPPGSVALAMELAELQGCEAATLLPSTLHLFWDLFRVLGQERVAILRDAGMYPIARWGTERAATLGASVHDFPHHDAAALARLAQSMRRADLRTIVVTDGYCPGCGSTAPIRAYGEIARRCDGYLVLDDTQALGILGESPSPANPYGNGGGGSLRWHRTFGPHIVIGSSLAKGFGAPVAVLAGNVRCTSISSTATPCAIDSRNWSAHSESTLHRLGSNLSAAFRFRCSLSSQRIRRLLRSCISNCSKVASPRCLREHAGRSVRVLRSSSRRGIGSLRSTWRDGSWPAPCATPSPALANTRGSHEPNTDLPSRPFGDARL